MSNANRRENLGLGGGCKWGKTTRKGNYPVLLSPFGVVHVRGTIEPGAVPVVSTAPKVLARLAQSALLEDDDLRLKIDSVAFFVFFCNFFVL